MFLHLIYNFIKGGGGSKEQSVPEVPEVPEVLQTPWRTLDWSKRREELEWLNSFRPQSGNVQHLRVLLCGPAGSGKSSFFNSVNSICKGRITSPAAANNGQGTDPELVNVAGQSYTRKNQTWEIQKETTGRYPFVFNDVMGLESGSPGGMSLDDIKLAMKGRVKEGYKFDPVTALDDSNDLYRNNPTSDDKAHILVFVVAVDINDVADKSMFKKMTEIRLAARDLGIPQIAILTKIDEKSSPLVKEDLKNVYRCTYIKKAAERLSDNVGFPLNCIFPLKNYHAEIELKDEVDILILSALQMILNLANDYANYTDVAAAKQRANNDNRT